MYIGTCEHRNVELPTASDGLAGHGLGLGRVYGTHMSRFPCSFGSVRASVARNTPWHSPPMVISHPLDFERAAATATGECIREAFGRFRDDMQRRGGVGERDENAAITAFRGCVSSSIHPKARRAHRAQ